MMAYRERAEQVVTRVTTQWPDASDVKALTDAVHHALVQEANLELRQIFAHMGGQLELAKARAARGQGDALAPEKLDALLDAVGRASAIMDVYLDRSAAAKLVIRIDAEPFDVGEALRELLRLQGIDEKVEVRVVDAPIVGDRQKLLDAIGHLVTRFYFAARPHEVALLSLADRGDGHLEGFVGLTPSHLRPEELMEEMHLPLNVEDVGIEVAYIRAVLERHGGTLFVATAGEASAGFGFTLPLARAEAPS